VQDYSAMNVLCWQLDTLYIW